jgi:hypothetical protein
LAQSRLKDGRAPHNGTMTDYRDRAKVYHAAIREILLNEWDPIGVSRIPEAHDEYDGYVGGVYRLLTTHANRHELFIHLWQIETDHMGLSGNRHHTEAIAEKLFHLRDKMEGAET